MDFVLSVPNKVVKFTAEVGNMCLYFTVLIFSQLTACKSQKFCASPGYGCWFSGCLSMVKQPSVCLSGSEYWKT